MEPSVYLAAGGMVIAGVVWLVRLEGRINLAESHANDLKDDISEIKRDVKQLLER